LLPACFTQVSLAPKAVSAGGETNEEKISKQADLLSEQVPKAFNIKVRNSLSGTEMVSGHD